MASGLEIDMYLRKCNEFLLGKSQPEDWRKDTTK